MLDAQNRQSLAEKLRSKVKKASSNVSTKVEAEKGDFKVIIAADSVTHLYKNKHIGTIKVAELDDEVVAYINSNPNDVAQEILDEFSSTFDADAFEKSAESKKEAAHSTQSDETHQMVTQKQLDEQKPSLHPRTDEHYTNITQKQLPEHGQRPGTYDIITEGQFRDERTTFYGADRTTGDWKQEDRNIVTEGQFEDGVDTYTEVGESDRSEMGSKYDGGVEKQWHQIGEKQLMELLRHHKWTEPLTVTEGKDQLGDQDGELARLTAEVAEQIIKEALGAMGNTILAIGITPDDLTGIVKQLTSHESKYPALANTIQLYTKADISAISKKIAKARHFGKTANVSQEWSDTLAADVLVRQLAKISYNPQLVVDALVALTNEDLSSKIGETADNILNEKEASAKEANNISLFKDVLAGKTEMQEGDDSDGLYSYVGAIKEVETSTDNQKKFSEVAADYAKTKIVEKVGEKELIPQIIDVDEDKGTFEIQFKDAAKEDDTLKIRAEKRREIAKEAGKKANMKKEAQMGGAGGMPPAAGPEMGNPMAPPGGADMGAPPPGEALSQEPMGLPEEGDVETGEPKPPGSVCPVCGSNDVDVDNGEFRCNNCGGEGTIHVRLDVAKWPETIEEKGTEEEAGFGLGEEEGIGAEEAGMASGMAAGEGEGTTLPNVPIGASVRITPLMLEKLGEQKIHVGTVCPTCGGHNTDLAKSAISKGKDGICWDCYQEYNFQVKANKNKKQQVYAQYTWMPKTADCPGCSRNDLKTAFVNSLANYGITWDYFDNLKTMREQADTILKMSKRGSLDIKQAMESPLAIEKFAASSRWRGSEKFDKFPSATCMERLSRRFGENATAMSGPCEGKKLADCVCGQLEELGIYTDGLAAKVAAVQSSKDPMVSNPVKSCFAMFVREGYDPDAACTICDGLRAAYADTEDLVIEAIAQINPRFKSMPAPGNVKDPATKPLPQPKPMRAPSTQMKAPAPMETVPTEAPMETSMEAVPMSKPMSAPMEAPESAKPMEDDTAVLDDMPSPMDEPIVEDAIGDDGLGGENEFNLEIGGDLDDVGFGDDLDVGMEGDTVTITLPIEAAEALETLFDVLKGDFGEDMIDTTGENALDVGEITEEVGENGEEEIEENIEEIPGEDIEEIPGVVDEEDELVKESEPEGSPMEAPEEAETTLESPMEAKPAPKPMEQPHREEKILVPQMAQSEEVIKEAQVQELDDLLYTMKQGTIRRQSDALDNILDGFLRQAKLASKDSEVKKMEYKAGSEGEKIKATPAQDTSEIGKIKDGGKIGHEEAFSSNVVTKPNVPRAAATMGDEGKEVTISETGDLPTVPHGSSPMAGEEHYRPEKGNVVDGNQGGGPMTSASESEEKIKTAEGDKNMKKAWTVAQNHKYYDAFCKRANAGEAEVKLTDGNTYNMTFDQNKNIVLTAKELPEAFKKNIGRFNKEKKDDKDKPVEEKDCKKAGKKEVTKEGQTVQTKKIKDLQDDPDLNPSSGAGVGKTHGDETHSLGVDEKKPSDGMSEPSVPEAPNDGRLAREHTVDKAKDLPEIPAGGGMNPEYDQNDKNEPEKQEELLGKENDMAAMATVSRDEATKIAGQMLKANMISIDELNPKIEELSKATPEILKDYENMIRTADTKGMRKQASADSVETPIVQRSSGAQADAQGDLKNSVQTLFTLNQRNRDYERYSEDRNTRLYR